MDAGDGLFEKDVKRSQDPSQLKTVVHVTQHSTPVKQFFSTTDPVRLSRSLSGLADRHEETAGSSSARTETTKNRSRNRWNLSRSFRNRDPVGTRSRMPQWIGLCGTSF